MYPRVPGNISTKSPSRRTLIYIDDYEPECGFVYVVVPAWEPKKVIRLQQDYLPPDILQRIQAGHRYFHAKVNLSAESHEALYFVDWEQE